MKKWFLVFILSILLFPLVVFSEESDIVIKNITFVEKIGYTEELEEPTIVNNRIILNVKMYDIEDSITYQFVVENKSDEDYTFESNSIDHVGDYMIFQVETEDNSYIIKPNTEKTFTLIATYQNEVDKSLFRGGKYNVELPSYYLTPESLLNPKTGSYFYFFLFIIMILIIMILKKVKNVQMCMFLLLGLFITPFFVNAAQRYLVIDESSFIIGYVIPNPCTYDGELVEDAEYVNGQYTYTYKSNHSHIDQSCHWNGHSCDYEILREINWGEGWSVVLTDKDSTDPVTTTLCTSINDKPIVSMENMFQGTKASSIDLSSFDTSNVVSMYQMFKGNGQNPKTNNFEELDVSNFDLSNTKIMDYMFEYLLLDNVDISNLDTNQVDSMSGAFSFAEIHHINISNLDLRKMRNAQYMFEYLECEELLLDNVQTEILNNVNRMFYGSSIPKVDISSFAKTYVTDLMEMFAHFTGDEVKFGEFDTSHVESMKYLFQSSNIQKIDISEIVTSNVVYFDSAFNECVAQEIVFPENFDSAENASIYSTFNSLTIPRLDLSGFDTSKVSSMLNTFYNCNCNEIIFSDKFVLDSVTVMGSMFSSIVTNTLDLSSFDVTKIPNDSYLFYNSSIQTVYVSSESDILWYRNNTNINPNINIEVKS